ncbi:unnamed protein product [Cochlearia groenlandica]
MTANDSSEAVSTLRGQCNNIDVVLTDYHMSDLNGVQLKKRIDEEFKNLPVIVISGDMSNEIEQETLSSGAMCFMKKPIKPNDIETICKHALNHRINGYLSPTNVEENVNNNQNVIVSEPNDEQDSRPQATNKAKIKWTSSLENLFYRAIEHIGVHSKFLNVCTIQKYRNVLKKVKEAGIEKTRRDMMTSPNFTSPSYTRPSQYPYNNYNTSLGNTNLYNSGLGFGLGQSSLMTSSNNNNNASLHHDDSINNMNQRRPAFDLSHTPSNLFPMRGTSTGFSNGMSPLNEANTSAFAPSQESQAPRYDQDVTQNNVLGMNSSVSTDTIGNSDYPGIRINDNGIVVGLGEIRVLSENGNSSLGEDVDGMMNSDYNNNNNMVTNHESSFSRLPSLLENDDDHLLSNMFAPTNDVVPILENPTMFNNDYGINEGLFDTSNSQFDQNQNQDLVTGGDLVVATDDLEMNIVNGDYPLEDITNWDFNNGNYNEETLSSIVGNSELHFPTRDINITNQEHEVTSLTEPPLSFHQDFEDEDFMKYLLDDMN